MDLNRWRTTPKIYSCRCNPLSHTIKPRLPGMMWPPGITFYICSKTSALIQVLKALSQIVCRVEHECVSLLQLH